MKICRKLKFAEDGSPDPMMLWTHRTNQNEEAKLNMSAHGPVSTAEPLTENNWRLG